MVFDNPVEKVQAFLDVAGEWDPTLALVMGSALGVNALSVPEPAALKISGAKYMIALIPLNCEKAIKATATISGGPITAVTARMAGALVTVPPAARMAAQ